MNISPVASRKEAIKEYKARKPQRGTFAVRCAATNSIWIGATPTLETVRNSLWFGLRMGNYYDKSLQVEWNTHGEQSFEFEILEKLDEDANPLVVKDLLKEQKSQHAVRLNARILL